MLHHLRPALVLLALFTLLTGVVYPLAITGIAQSLMPAQANGSLIAGKTGIVAGSSLIGQNFADAKYFQSRPSATSAPDPKDPTKTVDAPYNADNSSGSNLGPTSKALSDRVQAAVEAKKSAGWTGTIPADAVTTSGSGLDPDISPVNAYAQVQTVANARGIDVAKVKALVDAHVDGRLFGIIGEPRVNVLKLNIALDGLS
jgi:K+-transporting ATPase ATPase C chain